MDLDGDLAPILGAQDLLEVRAPAGAELGPDEPLVPRLVTGQEVAGCHAQQLVPRMAEQLLGRLVDFEKPPQRAIGLQLVDHQGVGDRTVEEPITAFAFAQRLVGLVHLAGPARHALPQLLRQFVDVARDGAGDENGGIAQPQEEEEAEARDPKQRRQRSLVNAAALQAEMDVVGARSETRSDIIKDMAIGIRELAFRVGAGGTDAERQLVGGYAAGASGCAGPAVGFQKHVTHQRLLLEEAGEQFVDGRELPLGRPVA